LHIYEATLLCFCSEHCISSKRFNDADSKLTMLKGAGHAASMFEKEPDLQADIAVWFRTNLPVFGYAVMRSLK